MVIFINGFFAATEIAFISLNDAKIDMMAKEENKKAKLIKKMLENKEPLQKIVSYTGLPEAKIRNLK